MFRIKFSFSGEEVHVQLDRIVAATFPEWLHCLDTGVLPLEVTTKTVEDFFECVIMDNKPNSPVTA